MPTALITGAAGQDGSYLAEFLVNKDYKVYGLLPLRGKPDLSNLAVVRDKITLLDGDMTDQSSLDAALAMADFDEVYNLAAQSFVGRSWSAPVYTHNVTSMGLIRLLEAVRKHDKHTRVYQASSSEIFGAAVPPQSERTPLLPNNPYAVAKAAAHLTARNYRESYGMHVSCGILFNHESERRGEMFVTQKIAKGAAMIRRGRMKKLHLGNLDAKRDWGYSPEYVEAMWKILQLEDPVDLVIGTGVAHSVEELVAMAFEVVGLDWREHVAIDRQFIRPVDVPELRAATAQAQRLIDWNPQVDLRAIVTKMVTHWLKEHVCDEA